MSIWKRAFVIIAAGYASLADAIVTAVTLGIYYPNFTGRLLAHFNYWGTAPSAPREGQKFVDTRDGTVRRMGSGVWRTLKEDGSPNWTDVTETGNQFVDPSTRRVTVPGVLRGVKDDGSPVFTEVPENGQKAADISRAIRGDELPRSYRRMKPGERVSKGDRIYNSNTLALTGSLRNEGRAPTESEIGRKVLECGVVLARDGVSIQEGSSPFTFLVAFREGGSEWADVNVDDLIERSDAARARFVLEPPEGYRFLKVGDYTKYGDQVCIGEGYWREADETYFGARCVDEGGYLKNIAGATSVRVARKETA